MIRSVVATSRRLGASRRFLRQNSLSAYKNNTQQLIRSFHFSRVTFAADPKGEEKGEDKGEDKGETKEENKSEKATPEQKAEKTQKTLLAEKDKEIADLKHKYMTVLADMQNLRTRTSNDVSSAKKYGGQAFAKSMLDVADNLSMALSASEKDATSENPKLKTLFEGVIMTEKALLKAFESNNVTKMKSLGEKFDPNLHDGMFQFEDATKTAGTVGQVVKDGYMLKDRVLRPTQCGTVKAAA